MTIMATKECEHGEPKGSDYCALCRWSGVGITAQTIEPKARNTDPATSKRAAKESLPKAGTQALALLIAHSRNRQGLTDEEACIAARLDLRIEYRTRCSTLRNLGLIEDTLFTRESSMGRQNMVRVITPKGIECIRNTKW